MALTQGARNKIKSIVQAAKKLLMNEFESQLQQYYGIRPDGSCLLVEELTAREASVIETARLLRQRLHYLEEGIAGKDKAPEAVRQLIREQAFTILNRFAAIRMSEERNIIRESVRKGYNSEGFLVYDQLTGGAKTAEQFTRYSWYIGHVFDELAIDLPSVFDRFSPYALLFPSEKVLLELLSIINDENVNIYREAGHQPINLWIEDETIGWIYQYYNSREEISEMREASGSPRNSRELAVRNQFFTPRYVVQFLVDNSLGRQWFEMTQGKTNLVDSCQYLVKQENEIFLQKGQVIPEAKIVGANYVEYQAIKDPREILMLDPACGSMHFGLYCFDLFEQIYMEAWDNHPELFTDLRDKYLRDDFVKRIPKYILRYNIHGVDIDPRAIQIAGLSLWLRAQKSYDKLGLQPAERPAISKSNLVIAEPMPGDVNILSEFTKSLPGPIGKLVRIIWEKMQLAGETGLLLKIEEELKKEIELAKEEYEEYKNSSAQVSLFDSPAQSKAAEMAAVYGKGQNITKDFFDTAEEEVLNALKSFAENAEGEDAFQKLLFAEDTARGFSFIELCRKKYDVIVMNPPFGAGSISTENYYSLNYPNWAKNILCCFFSRMNNLVSQGGSVGAIFDRTVIIKSSYENFRKENILNKINFVLDTGWGVLDANVETTSFVLSNKSNTKASIFIDLRNQENKELGLRNVLYQEDFIKVHNGIFEKLPNSVIGYDWSSDVLTLFKKCKNLKDSGAQARQGHALVSFNHFRYFWENRLSDNHELLYNGGGFSMFYMPFREISLIGKNHHKVSDHKSVVLRNMDFQFKPGIGYGKRGDYLDAHLLLEGFIFTSEGQAFHDLEEEDTFIFLSYLNSSSAQYLINLFCGQHKHAGYMNLLPFPEINHIKKKILKENTLNIVSLKQKWYQRDETTMEFLDFISKDNKVKLKSWVNEFIHEYENASGEYKDLIKNNDLLWLEATGLRQEIINDLNEKRPVEELLDIFKSNRATKNEDIIIYELIQNTFGRIFGRHSKDVTSVHNDIKTPHSQFLYTDFYSNSFNDFYSRDRIVIEIRKIINGLFTDIDVENELLDIIEESSLEDVITNTNLFFDYHFSRYSPSRREAPLYWPLATKSNSFIIWLYYPAITDSTLFSVVNELIDPKIKEVSKQLEILEFKGSSKELNSQREYLAELEDFKEEILRVAQLPYKPNQDDGVLITAAPLHNLFRHSKWKKSTQDCWKALEKGEFDWAHLAYSIWPDRVRKKCMKDLSMAIAHGLENLCEVKAKPKAEKKTKEIKTVMVEVK